MHGVRCGSEPGNSSIGENCWSRRTQRTFVQAIQNEALLKLVVDTVSEAITTSCLKGGETVSRDFKVDAISSLALRRAL